MFTLRLCTFVYIHSTSTIHSHIRQTSLTQKHHAYPRPHGANILRTITRIDASLHIQPRSAHISMYSATYGAESMHAWCTLLVPSRKLNAARLRPFRALLARHRRMHANRRSLSRIQDWGPSAMPQRQPRRMCSCRGAAVEATDLPSPLRLWHIADSRSCTHCSHEGPAVRSRVLLQVCLCCLRSCPALAVWAACSPACPDFCPSKSCSLEYTRCSSILVAS